MYELLRADFASDMNQRPKDQGENLLEAMSKLIDSNTSALDGLISARIDGVRAELNLEIDQIRAEQMKDTPLRREGSPVACVRSYG